MLAIAMYVCETPEEAALAVDLISATAEQGEGLMLVTTEVEGLHLICDLRSTTSMDSANDAIATSLEMLLNSALDLWRGTEPDSLKH